MALNLAQKDLLRVNRLWRSRIHIAVIAHALGVIKDIPNDAVAADITAEQSLAAKYRLQADNPDATLFQAAAAWIASLIDDPDFFGADISYAAIEAWLASGDGTYDGAIASIVAAFFPKIANLVAIEESTNA